MIVDERLIKKFLANRCNREEARMVVAYLEKFPEELEKHFPVDVWFGDTAGRLATEKTEKILLSIQQVARDKKSRIRRRLRRRIALAALGAGMVLCYWVFSTNAHKPIMNQEETIVSVLPEKYQLDFNNGTQNLDRMLPDSSVVTLTPGSSVRYLTRFDNSKRDVELHGHGRFRVKKDQRRPFSVFSRGIVTTALGTVFWVRELAGKKVSVNLLEGSVSVSKQNNSKEPPVILKPGETMSVSAAAFSAYTLQKREYKPTQTVKSSPVANEEKSGSLIFKNEPLGKVFARLDQHFGVTIRYEPGSEWRNMLFTGSFTRGEEIGEAIEAICRLYNLNHKIEDKVIFISDGSSEMKKPAGSH